jgi:hypothetical protein
LSSSYRVVSFVGKEESLKGIGRYGFNTVEREKGKQLISYIYIKTIY